MSDNIGLVIQGPITKFSLDCFNYYNFVLERLALSSVVILSCWDSDDSRALVSNFVESKYQRNIVFSKNINTQIARNLELQTITSTAGINLLTSDFGFKESDFIFKIRSDQFVNIDKLLESYQQFIKSNKSIWALDLFTRARIPFHLGDMVIGMSLKEHLIYWSPDSLVHEYEYQQWVNGSPFDVSRLFDMKKVKCLPEVCLLTNYLHKSQLSPIDGLGDWYVFLENHVYIESAETISLYSDKYKEKLNQRTFMPSRYFSPIHFFVSSYIIKCVSKGEKLRQVTNVKQLLLINWLTYPQTLIFGSIRFFYQLLSKSLISFIKK